MKTLTEMHWLLAQIKPNSGPQAERNLNRQGFTTLLPMERKTQRHRGQLRSVRAPYFPGYIFVGLGPTSSPWRAIRSTYGISNLVSFGLQPAMVPPEIIDDLLYHCGPDGCMQNHVQLAEGDKVQITHGPLTNFFARVEKLAPDERAWLLIDIMGKETRSLLKRADLQRTGQPKSRSSLPDA